MQDTIQLKKNLTVLSGAAMTTGAVLGAGIIVLPAITAIMAGPASILSWALMGVLTIPMIFIIGRLAIQYPDAGGMATYVQHGLGNIFSRWLSLLMMTALPFGMPITALIGAHYLGTFFHWPSSSIHLCAGIMILLAVCLNYRGIQLAGRTQVFVVSIILLILAGAIYSGLPQVQTAAFTPFLINGWYAVGQASALTFFAFTGWEMISYLAEEFHDPVHDIPKCLGISALIINAFYLSISFVTIGTSVYLSDTPATALLELITFHFGSQAASLLSILGCLACYCPIHIYMAGFSRLIYAQAREGSLPLFFSYLHPQFHTPHRALLAFLPVALLVLTVTYAFSFDLQLLINIPCANFLMIYALGMAAAIRLLQKSWEKIIAGLTTAAMIVLYFFTGWYAIFSVIITILFLLNEYRKTKTI